MNIAQAKEFIRDTVKIYLKKDEYGDYRIPVVRQRPIFLLGAPGVGKTAIMEQVAAELGIALVSYSMTHHTRQSALGLPFIVQKEYAGEKVDVSEYTMSEIIASIYEVIENTGISEGILFLDEINCVSETLAPAMLQFLQYKVFGRHAVPEGWIIVTAGNPPEYNKSVREFDVVTMDRMKVLEVEPEYAVWKQYAIDKRLHGAVVNYLEINKDDFYVIETTVKGRGYVTARGWEDLSQIITLYEEDGLTVDESLVGQYLCNERVVREFSAYYDLYCRYVSDYRIDEVLNGVISEQSVDKARKAGFDERMSIVGIFTDKIIGNIKDVIEESDVITSLFTILKAVKASNQDTLSILTNISESRRSTYESKLKAGAISDADKRKEKAIRLFLDESNKSLKLEGDKVEDKFTIVKQLFDDKKKELKTQVDIVSAMLDYSFEFLEQAFGTGNELVLFLTELTVNGDATKFVGNFGHEKYMELSKKLMIEDSNKKLLKRIEDLDL